MTIMRIEFECDNSAFADDLGGEIARILTKLARQVSEDPYRERVIHDINGNSVGTMKLDE